MPDYCRRMLIQAVGVDPLFLAVWDSQHCSAGSAQGILISPPPSPLPPTEHHLSGVSLFGLGATCLAVGRAPLP